MDKRLYGVVPALLTPLNEDGSLDILLQAEAPEEHANNLLPTGNAGFHLFMRVYLPRETVQDGTWQAPALTKQ